MKNFNIKRETNALNLDNLSFSKFPAPDSQLTRTTAFSLDSMGSSPAILKPSHSFETPTNMTRQPSMLSSVASVGRLVQFMEAKGNKMSTPKLSSFNAQLFTHNPLTETEIKQSGALPPAFAPLFSSGYQHSGYLFVSYLNLL